jgi:hypothetical protein
MPPFFCLRISDTFCPENLCAIFALLLNHLDFLSALPMPNDSPVCRREWASESSAIWLVAVGSTGLLGRIGLSCASSRPINVAPSDVSLDQHLMRSLSTPSQDRILGVPGGLPMGRTKHNRRKFVLPQDVKIPCN